MLAQEKKDAPVKAQTPMKKDIPMTGEGMQGCGVDMSKMKDMHDKIMEMKKGMGGMMKGRA